MPDWTLRANRNNAVKPFGMVQNMYRTRTVQYQRIYDTILFWKIILNRSLIVISGLYTQIMNHNISNIALCKLVLTGFCCKHFTSTCMHLSCTLFCMHVECFYLFCDPLLFIVQNSDRILLKYECQIFLFP